MKIYTVSLFGHRRLKNITEVERRLETVIAELLREKEYVEFLIGREGDFDLLAASVIKRCQRTVRADNSALVWVMPYLTAEYRKHETAFLTYYDQVETSQRAENKYFKGAIQLRNREMVDRSDLAVFCVERQSGGAYQTMRYAEQRNSPYYNVAGSEPLLFL